LISEKRILARKVDEKTKELKEKNDDILSSIEYAKKIQGAILPPIEKIKKSFPNSFILYQPKDIVSGDFYWFDKKNGKSILAVVDCTGHGVPGAFMSMIGHNLLHQIIMNEGIITPSEILNRLDKGVVEALKQNELKETKDGMDICLISYDEKTNNLEYAGAYRPLYIYRKTELIKIDADKFPIGGGSMQFSFEKEFTNNNIPIEKDDVIYMFSDGYADQFGGPKGKKMMVKRFQQILLEIKDKPMDQQNNILFENFKSWKAWNTEKGNVRNLEQVDDVLLVGIKF